MIRVDHRNPIHDGFCRCSTCKPSLVGARSGALIRVRIGAGALAVLAGVLVFAAGR